MSIEARLEALTAAVEANTEQLKVMNAGREAALEQLKGSADGAAATAPKAPRASRKKADEAPTGGEAGNGAGEPAGSADTGSAAAAVTPAADEPQAVTEDDLRNAAQSYIGGAGDDKPARQARGAKIKEITNHFATETLVGPTGITDPVQRKQALFFLKRLTAGLETDFAASYDFDGDPSQEVSAGEDTANDDFNIG